MTGISFSSAQNVWRSSSCYIGQRGVRKGLECFDPSIRKTEATRFVIRAQSTWFTALKGQLRRPQPSTPARYETMAVCCVANLQRGLPSVAAEAKIIKLLVR
jgi:hypothetical protein